VKKIQIGGHFSNPAEKYARNLKNQGTTGGALCDEYF